MAIRPLLIPFAGTSILAVCDPDVPDAACHAALRALGSALVGATTTADLWPAVESVETATGLSAGIGEPRVPDTPDEGYTVTFRQSRTMTEDPR